MQDSATSSRHPRYSFASFVFVLVGLLFVVSSVLFRMKQEPIGEAIALNLGLATLAIVLVDIVWHVSGGNPLDSRIHELDQKIGDLSRSIEVLDHAASVGLSTVYGRQGDFGTQTRWEDLIRGAHGSVDIMGRTASGWLNSASVSDLIISKVRRDKVQFRWLVMSRDNHYLPYLMEDGIVIAAKLIGKIDATEKFLCDIRGQLNSDELSLFQAKAFESVPLYCGIVRSDSHWHVTQYLSSRPSTDSPFTCLSGTDGAWVAAYRQEFDSIWKSAKDLFHADQQPRADGDAPIARPPMKPLASV
jgi:hypothetical protein